MEWTHYLFASICDQNEMSSYMVMACAMRYFVFLPYLSCVNILVISKSMNSRSNPDQLQDHDPWRHPPVPLTQSPDFNSITLVSLEAALMSLGDHYPLHLYLYSS
jgi:hypothetical protein